MLLENVSFKGKTGIITGGAQGIGKAHRQPTRGDGRQSRHRGHQPRHR